MAVAFTKPSPAADLPWQELLSKSIVSAKQLASVLPVDEQTIERVIKTYPMRINPYVLSLIMREGDPVWRQAIPDIRELDPAYDMAADPLWEGAQSPVPHVIHRYPDRVVFTVSNQCAMYCRHCMRKRAVGQMPPITERTLDAGIAYINDRPSIREVILSGGDPLLLSDDRLCAILKRIHAMDHVELIRVHTRVPCTLPQRITASLVEGLRRFSPLYVNIQFNHPDEITHGASEACGMLADAGIPLGSQSVLLKGVNDDPEVMMRLMRELLKIRVRPYYLHHADPVRGTHHFRTSVDRGLEIMRALRGRLSGMGVPCYMIDLPAGGGKVPLLPRYLVRKGESGLVVKNYQGRAFNYPG